MVSLVTGLSACGGGGDGDESYVPTLPANATRIEAADSIDIANSVLGMIDALSGATALKESQTKPTSEDLLRLAIDSVKQELGKPAGIANKTQTESCDTSGKITLDYEETDTSASGKATFDKCVIGGVTIDGKMLFDLTYDSVSGAYSDDFNGSISFAFSGENATIVFDLKENGNEITGNFSGTVAFSVEGSMGGFLVTTTKPISGTSGVAFEGTLIVQGGEKTRLRVNVISTTTASVDYDDGSGTFASQGTIPI